VESGSAHTTSAGNGRNILASLQSAGDADEPSTAAKSVRRVHGFIIDIGVWLHNHNTKLSFSGRVSFCLFAFLD